MIRVHSRPPRIAQVLGLSGLLPMLGCLLLMAVGPTSVQATAFQISLIYAAVIFSFVGGAWWGLAARDDIHPNFSLALVISVLPSLIAAICLFVMGAWSMLVLALGFGGMLLVDRRLVESGQTPEWWLGLRRPLALGMAAGNGAIGVLALVRGIG
jgi:hypothetical protein